MIDEDSEEYRRPTYAGYLDKIRQSMSAWDYISCKEGKKMRRQNFISIDKDTKIEERGFCVYVNNKSQFRIKDDDKRGRRIRFLKLLRMYCFDAWRKSEAIDLAPSNKGMILKPGLEGGCQTHDFFNSRSYYRTYHIGQLNFILAGSVMIDGWTLYEHDIVNCAREFVKDMEGTWENA